MLFGKHYRDEWEAEQLKFNDWETHKDDVKTTDISAEPGSVNAIVEYEEDTA